MTDRDPSRPGAQSWFSRLRGAGSSQRPADPAARPAHPSAARTGSEDGSSRPPTTRELPVVGPATGSRLGQPPAEGSSGPSGDPAAHRVDGELDETFEDPEVGPQTAAINLNMHNPVQADAYGSPESREAFHGLEHGCLLYTSPSPRDRQKSRMPSSA